MTPDEWNKQGQNAFPACDEANVNGTMGMTLRDYFAAQALCETLTRNYGNDWGKSGIDYPKHAARAAYGVADAMLAERDKPK